ncbi:MAG: A/G-specific adenine glycosylase [Thermoguttaceae bacterium]
MMTTEPMTLPDTAWFTAFRRRALRWYARHARALPWRRSRDPYRVWLSETMLQQTQVETVIGYFDRFLQALPTVEALAQADEQDVLRLWEGLGYYRRARQLHRAAKVLVAEHGGRFPCDPSVVRDLPGIGRYTAGAVLSIAFDARQPILEANTLRLWSRLLGFDGDPQSGEGQRLLWAAAEAVLPRRGAGRLNQALMDLGSQVCASRTPRCDSCPAASCCRANQEGRQADIPRPKAKPPVEAVREAAVVVLRGDRVLLIRWPEGRRWAGLWDFPRFTMTAATPAAVRRELVENVRAMTGMSVVPGQRIHALTHTVTRFRIRLECYRAEPISRDRTVTPTVEMRWVRPTALNGYPLSSTGRILSGLIAAC